MADVKNARFIYEQGFNVSNGRIAFQLFYDRSAETVDLVDTVFTTGPDRIPINGYSLYRI